MPAIAAVVIAFASTVVERSHATVHADQKLVEWVRLPTTGTVRAVVQVREGAVCRLAFDRDVVGLLSKP